jgi:phosphodiesterase/alkaline phosphatase D-like protein
VSAPRRRAAAGRARQGLYDAGMRRLLALALLILAPAAPASARGFSLGVSSGDVTATTAMLWTRAPHAGNVQLVLFDDSSPVPDLVFFPFPRRNATRARDLTVRFALKHLRPNRRYLYQFVQGSTVSELGAFRTPPLRGVPVRVRFAVTGDADATVSPVTKRRFNDFGVYGRMQAERNDFNVNLGDTIYSDSEQPGAGRPALSVRAKWARYRANIAMPKLRKLRQSGVLYEHWDDHEFINDFNVAQNGRALYAAGSKAFFDYNPVRTVGAGLGLYRTFRWGKNLQLFFLDLRSFRSAPASAHGVCDNAGRPDPAPTVPQPLRTTLALAGFTQLATPVPAACTAAIADPRRTMLGRAQLAAFEKDVAASTARFKVVLTEDPIEQFYAFPYDRFEGYAAERTALLQFLATHVKNLVFLATDTHANFVNTVNYSTLGHLSSSPFFEVVTGPAAAERFGQEVDAALGHPGIARVLAQRFLRAPAPSGVGMRCANISSYAYAEVTVTRSALSVRLKDAAGKRIVDVATGKPCAPLVVPAR